MSTGADDGKDRGKRQGLRQEPSKLYHLAGQTVPVGFKVYQHPDVVQQLPSILPKSLKFKGFLRRVAVHSFTTCEKIAAI